jgi:hypothetical protein
LKDAEALVTVDVGHQYRRIIEARKELEPPERFSRRASKRFAWRETDTSNVRRVERRRQRAIGLADADHHYTQALTDLCDGTSRFEKGSGGIDEFTLLAGPPARGTSRRLNSGCWPWCGDRQRSNAKAVRMVSVRTVERPRTDDLLAIIAPNAQVDLAFRIPGYVVAVHQAKAGDGRIRPLEPGDPVTSGPILARIRASDYQAVSTKPAARAMNRRRGSARRKPARRGPGRFRASRCRLRTHRDLWRQESITKPAYDGSKETRRRASKGRRRSGRHRASRQRSTEAAAQLQEARIALGDAVRAPFTGTLLERRVDVGTLAAAGTPAFVVADLHLVKARFQHP